MSNLFLSLSRDMLSSNRSSNLYLLLRYFLLDFVSGFHVSRLLMYSPNKGTILATCKEFWLRKTVGQGHVGAPFVVYFHSP